MGSPKFKLFWSDVKPMVLNWAKGVGLFAVTTGAAVLSDPAFQAAVANNFGRITAAALATILSIAVGKQFLADNSKG